MKDGSVNERLGLKVNAVSYAHIIQCLFHTMISQTCEVSLGWANKHYEITFNVAHPNWQLLTKCNVNVSLFCINTTYYVRNILFTQNLMLYGNNWCRRIMHIHGDII